MSNRILVYLTGIVILGMILLLALNMTSILTGEPKNQTYLKYNDVRGMAVSYHDLLYTLNFKQQNQVIKLLNQSVRVLGINPEKREKPPFDKIVIYQFEGKPDIILHPVAYVERNLVFSVPEWESNGFLMELSEGDLAQLLSQTYDH